MSAGDTAGMLHLTDAFLNHKRMIRFGNLPRYGKSRGNANLIQIGLPRNDDHNLYRLIQSELFFLTPTGPESRDKSVSCPESPFERGDEDPFDPAVVSADRFVILSRMPNSNPTRSITAITSNHGRSNRCSVLISRRGITAWAP